LFKILRVISLMSGTFGKFVLPSLFVSGAVFAVLAVPLAVYGSEKVDLQLSESIGVTGTIQDFTAPYLGVSGLASLAVGGATAAIAGVTSSKKKAAKAEQEYLTAQANFQNRERQLQDALLSESSLVKSGLGFFLDDAQVTAPDAAPSFPVLAVAASAAPLLSQPIVPVAVTAAVPAPVVSTQPVIVASAQPEPLGFTVNSSNMGVQPVKVPRVTAQAATSPLHAAHGFMSFSRAGRVITPAAIAWAEEPIEHQTATQQLDVLQGQLQGLMTQIEQIQVSLQTKAVVASPSRIEVIQADRPLVAATTHRFQSLEHSWTSVPQRVAS
jgi:hypothetical protein